MLSKAFMLLIPMISFLFAGPDLKPGDKAPDFELMDGEGKVHKLADYKDKIVALYFYPKDDSPGCTKQACNLRDNYSLLKEKDIVILGVSFDDSTAHKEFKAKYDLPFPLLSDINKEVAEAYGAKRTLSFMGASRITFIIGKDGKILHIIDDVDTGNHSAQIINALEKKG